ncbi:MAG: transglycosylase SLT domain-containing protein [Bdellovibrionales bacterium]
MVLVRFPRIWVAITLVIGGLALKSYGSDEDSREVFKKGVLAFQQKQYDKAAAALEQVPELGDYLSVYKHWYLGQSYLELAKYKEAEPEFIKIIQSQASSDLKNQSQFFLGEIALREKKYADAIKKLKPLDRKWRRSHRYPEVLYRLMTADLKLGHTANVCARARKLYSKYPSHPLVLGWGSDLSRVEVDGKALPCKQSQDDFADRMRSLQWSGESDKAHREIVDVMSKAPESQRADLDMVLAGFLINEGAVHDALNLLIRYYPKRKSSFEYLMLLGKAASRSGEYQTAVGAYERASSLSPRSRGAREALYYAAYQSYQFQDYDGAVRKYQQFIKQHPKSGLARDAQWHLAWLQYLRNDFRGALEKFTQVQKSYKRKRRQSDSLQERLLYWMAMSHIRLNDLVTAREELEAIVKKNPYSYYGLAAQARLETILPKLDTTPLVRVPSALPEIPIEGGPMSTNMQAAAPSSTPDEEKESEEDLAAAEEGQEAPVELEDGPLEEEKLMASEFKDPAHRARIEVAQKLMELGLPELARWELYEVERKTRNRQYLRMLIGAYEGIGSYNRSAGIAELAFGKEREQGLEAARALWVSTYPQAYKSEVKKAADYFGAPSEWIWSIMRAESFFKPDVISPVGAKGLMQIMPYTARNLNRLRGETGTTVPDLLDPEVNIRLGAQYLARLHQKFKGQLPLVAAAYNAGPHRVGGWLVNFGHLEMDEWVEHIPFLETRNYVKKVVRYHTFYRRLYSSDEQPVSYLAKSLGVPIPSRAPTRENWDSL